MSKRWRIESEGFSDERAKSRTQLYEREARDRAYSDWAYDLLDDPVPSFHSQPFVTVVECGFVGESPRTIPSKQNAKIAITTTALRTVH